MYGILWTQYACISISLNISCSSSAIFSAPPAESVPGKLLDIIVHQVRPHVDKQDSLSGKLRRGESLQANPVHHLMAAVVDPGMQTCFDRFYER